MKRITAILLLLIAAGNAGAKDIYVSPNGSDNNRGTKERPFATLYKAQQEARLFKEKVTIYLRGGTYYLNRPLEFTMEDSRTEQAPLIWMAFPAEHPVLKGSVQLKVGFELFKDGIYKATLPADLQPMDQLFINGVQQHMARYPNYKAGVLPYGGTAADVISHTRVAGWKDPAGGFVHAMHSGQWGDMHYRITGKYNNDSLLLEGGWQNNRPSPMHRQYRFVENIFEELDAVGEWYASVNDHTLYYIPEPGANLKKALIETPVLETLVQVKGSPGKPVSNISFNGIGFSQTLRTFMKNKEPLLRSDWTICRSGALTLEYAEHCSIENCTFTELGGNAIVYSNYNRYNTIEGCNIFNIGASAVCFVGNPASVRSPVYRYEKFTPYELLDKTPGPKGDDFPAQCKVFNNLIHNIGLTEKQVAGIQLSMSQNIIVDHNTIYNVPRAGINVSEGCWGGHEICYNDVFNTVMETGDHGAFNSWGRDRYWHPVRTVMDTLVKNHPELILLDAVQTTTIHHNRFRCDNGWDIDLDDGSSRYFIYSNICLNGGIKLREGFHRRVENNIIINNTFHPHVWFANSEDTFRRNIVSAAYLPIRVNDWGNAVDSNFFPDKNALKKVQQWGVDKNSLYGSAMFRDFRHGDYTVDVLSTAFSLGFENVNMNVGVISPALKQLAATVPLPQTSFMEDAGGKAVAFLSIKVKNLQTLAERSATGMDTTTGVLVTEVPETSPLHNILLPNDVLLQFADQPVTDVKSLFAARMLFQSRRTADLVIFRDQRRQQLTIPLKQQ
ncbi:MAG: PDZ domain-containing protein [Chitinophagaceae bacterium]